MHPTGCLLVAACIWTAVFAFIPYEFNLDLPATKHTPSRRFLPWESLSDTLAKSQAQANTDTPITLDVKRAPVRRSNDFDIVLSKTPSWPNTAALDQNGNDLTYFAVVKIGSEAQEFYLMLDTGGTNSWVFSSDCTTKACSMHDTFDATTSSSINVTTTEWSVGYGSGSASGVLATDNVTLADVEVQFTFGLATNASNNFESYAMDGILGFGRSNDTAYNTATFMDAVADQKNFDSNVVGFALSRTKSGEKDGTVTIGGVDKDKYTGEISYTDTASESGNYWRIPVDDVYVNGDACDFTDKSAIIDTGTSYAMLPSKDAKTLHALIPDATAYGDYFLLPCNSTAKVQVAFSGVNYTISPEDYIGSEYNSSCISTIVSYDLFGDDIWLLGDVFLKNVYTVFDFDASRVGLAVRAYNKNTTASSSSKTSNSSSGTSTGSTASSSSTSSTGGVASGATSQSGSRFYLPAFVVVLCTVLL
ncbi:putative aspartic-type endopeptidase [Aspergillus uvarum CBS 121591]|uniref:Putative aspartic-type endopeptidase n=1 Tax=Aspergillus uvarum CBS 121591 TaxID=1448315 RepID=A0A319CNW4_9EURO|nr:putative aspartic-type endopeptidase [Aspergillus uvarum CBS 121591]PYH77178.1 putative aspartic-type endopeptidase [Aspergillus uvarum CBS 121591]